MSKPIDFDVVMDRLFTHVKAGTTDQADDVYTIDVAQFSDKDRFDREVETLFRRTPLLVSLSSDFREAGSFKTMEIADVPFLLTRADDGSMKAFLNVCRHRGARLVSEESGCTKRFVCPFHAWSYNMSGKLTGVPAADTFGEFDRAQRALVSLPCEERDGLIWVLLTPGLELDLTAHLGALGPELASFGFRSGEHIASRRLETGNWKLAMDTYLENYHVGFLHQKTLAVVTLTNKAIFDSYGPHQRMIVPRKSISNILNAPPGYNPFDYLSVTYTIFPNTVLLVTPETAMLSWIVPGKNADRSVTIQDHFTLQPFASEEARKTFDARVELLFRAVSTEDYWIQDGVQASLSSNANATFLLGRNELGLQNFHRSIDRACEAANSDLGPR